MTTTDERENEGGYLRSIGYLPPLKHQPVRKLERAWEGAKMNRLTSDWQTSQTSLDYDMRWQLRPLIDRSRHIAQNTGTGEGYLKLMVRNVLGARPFQLQMRILENDGVTHDRLAETIIERAWKDQSKKRNWTIMGTMSSRDHYEVILRAILQDGAALIRKHRSPDLKYGFALEPLDIDYLDVEHNEILRDGSRIVMGVEFNLRRQPVAYHLLGYHPGDYYADGFGKKRTRVDARDIIHTFFFRRAVQSRGFPEFASIMPNVRQLDGYQQAELVAARTAAGKMGFFTKQPGEGQGYTGQDATEGGKYMDVEPGTLEELPAGMGFQQWDPQHPSTAYADFVKAHKREQSAALGVAYMTYAQDPGDASFSSARVGLVDEREGYKAIQQFIIEHICEDVFEDWLFTALAFGKLGNLPASKFDKFNQPHFIPRSWEWLDPKADAEANAIAEDRGWKSPAEIIGGTGGDEEEKLDQIEQTHERRAALGLVSKARLDAGAEAMAKQSQAENDEAAPLATALGVGGTQSLALFVQSISMPDSTLSEDQILVMLTKVFGMKDVDARRLAKKQTPPRTPAPAPAPVSA
jgi:lambda family phage portal protein